MILAMTRKKMLFSILLGIATLLLIAFHGMLYGLASLKVFPWEEDSFKGKLLSEFESKLTSQGRGLMPMHAGSFYSHIGRPLRKDQRWLRFTKGKEYRWFFCISAINVGYVVTEKEGEHERIVEIIREISLDGP
jgi:translation elongation factor EF-1beta